MLTLTGTLTKMALKAKLLKIDYLRNKAFKRG